ncbi:MAG TPA: hypothetical protein PLH57_11970, partial [Oligoflexia bacterium]|nr:hypothetical protein [Oligoflexia bacterium]
MTKQKIYFYSFDKQLFEQMRGTIPGEVADLVWVQSEQQEWCAKQRHLTIVDGKRNDLRARLEELSHKKAYVVLLLNEDIAETQLEGDLGASLENGLVDDILLTPIRTVEVLSKMKHVAHLARVDDVNLANEQLKFVIGEMEADLLLARGIQKHLIPEKFKQVPGFQVNHKYLSGFKAGGDYLDFFEFEDST